MNEIMRVEKNPNDESDMDISKKIQSYNSEIFQFRKNTGPKQIEASNTMEETKSVFQEKNNNTSSKPWNTLKAPTIPEKNSGLSQLLNTPAEEKKEEIAIDNSLKVQSIVAKSNIMENPGSSYQLPFNIFEVKFFSFLILLQFLSIFL